MKWGFIHLTLAWYSVGLPLFFFFFFFVYALCLSVHFLGGASCGYLHGHHLKGFESLNWCEKSSHPDPLQTRKAPDRLSCGLFEKIAELVFVFCGWREHLQIRPPQPHQFPLPRNPESSIHHILVSWAYWRKYPHTVVLVSKVGHLYIYIWQHVFHVTVQVWIFFLSGNIIIKVSGLTFTSSGTYWFWIW